MVRLACHIHSDWSYDGKWPLSRLAAVFQARGYQVLMMTEHDRGFTEGRWQSFCAACAQASSETFLVLPGMEYSEETNAVHILTWGLTSFLGEGVPTAELLKRVDGAHGVAVLAHPSRREAWRQFDAAWCDQLLGIEVWNRKTDGWAPSPRAWELLRNNRVQPFVGLDFHDDRQRFPLAMEVQGGTPLNAKAILDSVMGGQACPKAFGGPLGRVGHGPVAAGLRLAESCRRRLASVYRQLKR